MRPGCLHDLERERPRVAVLDGEREAARVEPARREHLFDDPRQAVGLARDHGQQPAAMVVVKLDVLAPERHRRAVDRGERRSQLVRDHGHELALDPLDAALLGQIAKRVHGPVGELDGRDRDPELPVAELERQCLGVLGGVGGGAGDGDERLDRPPAGEHLLRPAAEDVVALEARDRRERGIPQPDDAGAVDEEDAVADVSQDSACALPRPRWTSSWSRVRSRTSPASLAISSATATVTPSNLL